MIPNRIKIITNKQEVFLIGVEKGNYLTFYEYLKTSALFIGAIFTFIDVSGNEWKVETRECIILSDRIKHGKTPVLMSVKDGFKSLN